MAVNTSLRAEIRMFQNNIRELENLNQVLRDEHQALQLAFAALEEKLRRAQVDFLNLLSFSNFPRISRHRAQIQLCKITNISTSVLRKHKSICVLLCVNVPIYFLRLTMFSKYNYVHACMPIWPVAKVISLVSLYRMHGDIFQKCVNLVQFT